MCEFIIQSFDFCHEHLYEFCMDNRMYSKCSYQYEPDNGSPSTDIRIDQIGLVKGQIFSLHYDFGDDWMFTISTRKIEEEPRKKVPALLKSVGSVEQYHDWEEWEDE